jgi:hypothetical protein
VRDSHFVEKTVIASFEDKYVKSANRGIHRKSSKIRFRRALPVLALLVGSYIVGFALVISFYRPAQPSKPAYAPTRIIDAGPQNEIESDGADTVDKHDSEYDEGEAPPEVPPGRTPDGVAFDEAALYLKCWDSDGAIHRYQTCDSLNILEKRFSTRLYVVDQCKRRYAGEETEGELSLAAQVDFEQRSVSFWSGPSSDLENAKKVATCVRKELAGLPIYGIDHKFEKYRIFFTLKFRDPEELKKEFLKKRKRTRAVSVIKDHVRVRKAPSDGYVLGKISTGSQVSLIDRRGDWCRVLTPNNREGWMICDALSL